MFREYPDKKNLKNLLIVEIAIYPPVYFGRKKNGGTIVITGEAQIKRYISIMYLKMLTVICF